MKQCRKAFSLLEILIVIALMAGLTAITIPTVFSGLKSDLPHNMRQLGAMIKNLKFISITKNQPLQLVFDFDEQNCYVLQKQANSWTRDDEQYPPLKLTDGVTFRYFKSGPQLITARQAKINILPFGYVDQFQITLQKDERKMFIKTVNILGKITIADDENLFF